MTGVCVGSGLGWSVYLSVLLHQLGEVVEEAMLGPQEVKLVVPLLLADQTRHKLAAITRHELSRQPHDIPEPTERPTAE